MTTKRRGISKKTRFEVFKRDGFKCQYCGAAAPDVLLEVDHIQPVSKDGQHDMLNFVTACKPCNLGKGARKLDDDTAVKKQRSQLAELQERREQLEMMLQWRTGLRDIEADEVDAVSEAWSLAAVGWHLNDTGQKEARKLIKQHGLQSVLDAIEVVSQQYLKVIDGKASQESVALGWRKVGGVCALSKLPEDERRLYYVKAILNKRLNYTPYDVMDDLKAALQRGRPVADMEREAKHCGSWTAFSNWLYGI